jgi:hypothetical protein
LGKTVCAPLKYAVCAEAVEQKTTLKTASKAAIGSDPAKVEFASRRKRREPEPKCVERWESIFINTIFRLLPEAIQDFRCQP